MKGSGAFFIMVCMLLLFAQCGVAADYRIITLKDGSSLEGELVSMNNGVCSVRTPMAGSIKIKLDDLVSIERFDASQKTSKNSQDGGLMGSHGSLINAGVESLMTAMKTDADIMGN